MPLGILIFVGLLAMPAYALEDYDRQVIEQRIKPVGSVRVEQKTGSNQTAKATQPVAAKKTELGQDTYEKYCTTCHRDGVAGAPKFRDSTGWKDRIASKKLDGLVASALKGLNAMPAKGTCMECNDDDIKNAVKYMLPKS